MGNNLSQWGKDVKKAMIDKELTIKQVANETGHCVTTVSQLINGRYAKSNYIDIAEKINRVLGTEGLPPRPDTPSEEWCKSVRKALIDRDMSITDMAKDIGFTRDKVSLVLNGHYLDEPVIDAINRKLDINNQAHLSRGA